jgi:alpha-L-rhamnosidase
MGQMVRAWVELDFESESESDIELSPRQSFSNRDAGFIGSCYYKTTARPGRRTFITTDDYTCRLVYLQLHTGKIKIHGLKVVERRYPFDRIGSFRCNDDFLNQFWDMSMQTSEVDATDGYIDGSEGGEWVTGHIDYPVTQVAFAAPDEEGKPIYSDMRLLGNQISRMALSQEGDELIKGWHPSDWHKGPRIGMGIHNFIEDSSLLWVNLLRTYYEGTGDSDLVEREWPVLEKIMKWFLDRRTERGLVNAREFFLHFDNPIAFNYCEGATLNAMVYRELVDAACLAEKLDKKNLSNQYSNAAKELSGAYNKYLWDAPSGTYYAGLKQGEKKSMYGEMKHGSLMRLQSIKIKHFSRQRYRQP